MTTELSTQEITEHLTELGIHKIENPTPFPNLPTNNCFALETSGGLMLIDSGVNSSKVLLSIESQLKMLGLSVIDIERILLTHGHLDHYGIAQRLATESRRARIYVSEGDVHKVAFRHEDEKAMRKRYKKYFKSMAVPAQSVEMLAGMPKIMEKFSIPVSDPVYLKEGDRFAYKSGEIEVIACPGHTKGLVVFYDRHNRILFSGDHLLLKTSPNPIAEINPDGTKPFRSLVSYIESIQKLVDLPIDFVLTGHGEYITDHRGVIEKLLEFYKRRQERILRKVELAARPLDVYEITRLIMPNISEIEISLGISEAIGNLEVMVDAGTIIHTRKKGVSYFERTH